MRCEVWGVRCGATDREGARDHPDALPTPPTSHLPPHTSYCTTGLGMSFAAHSPLLKSVKSTRPFQGIAFITNGALGV